MRYSFFLLFYFIGYFGYSQYQKQWYFPANTITKVVVHASDIATIKVKANAAIQHVTLKVYADGEYVDQSFVTAHFSKDVLEIKDEVGPIYFQDKLSAHKTIALALVLELPITTKLYIDALDSSIVMQGSLQKIKVYLRQGTVFLEDFSTSGSIHTIAAPIYGSLQNTQLVKNKAQCTGLSNCLAITSKLAFVKLKK